MKKILLLILLVFLAVFGLVACSSDTTTTDTSSEKPGATTTKQPETTSTPTTTAEITTAKATTSAPTTLTAPVTLDLCFTETMVCTSKDDPVNRQEGKLAHWDRWYSTDYIDISDYYALSYELAAHQYLISVAFYDKDKTYLEGIGTPSTLNATTIQGSVVIPEGTVYARYITWTGTASHRPFETPVVNCYADKASYDAYYATLAYPELTIACFGDSLTEGDNGNFNLGAPEVDYRNYPYYLAKALGCTVINYGRNGHTATSCLQYFNSGAADISDCDIILIMLGTNYGLTVGGNQQYQAYVNLLRAIELRKKKDAKIILMTPPGIASYSREELVTWVTNGVEGTLRLGEEKGYTVINVNKDGPIQPEKSSIYQPSDGCHMRMEGYRALGNFVAKELIKIMNEK